MAKQVIVIRKDLKMRLGKAIAQGAHASMKVFLDKMEIDSKNYCFSGNEYIEASFHIDSESEKEWITGCFTKVCVYVNSEEELLALYNKAKEKKILCTLVTDAGKTEFHGVSTNTCIAIGPAEETIINELTGGLPLL